MADQEGTAEPKKVDLVFQGGGVKGIALVGALSVIDPLAGTETAVPTLADLALPPYTTLVVRVVAASPTSTA